MADGLLHLAWNLLLALLAVGLAFALVRMARAHRARQDRVLVLPLVLVGIAWILMLPNTCYLFTEVRHFFDAIEDRDLWSRSVCSTSARWSLASRSIVLGLYGAVGALSYGWAIRPVRKLLDELGAPTRRVLPVFFALVALGVYLGLVQRMNSWDVLTQPAHVLANAIDAVRAPRRLLGVVLGGAVLWTIYEMVDIWIDGAIARFRRTPRALSDAPARA
jgi:uncharacterized membrane protein